MIANDERYESEQMDREVMREMDHLTSGAAAHHRQMRPDEMAMMHEEGEEDERSDRDRLREEIFSGVCDYTLGAGLHPARIRERMEVVMRRFAPEILPGMRGRGVWWDEQAVMRMLDAVAGRVGEPCPGMLFSLSAKIREEKDQKFVSQSFNGLCRFWVEEGMDWKRAVSAHLVIVKALRPELIGQMSLEEIAVLCGDKGKATVSARAKRIFSRRLAEAGSAGTHAHFQKSPEAVAKYRAAQMGNTNRRKN